MIARGREGEISVFSVPSSHPCGENCFMDYTVCTWSSNVSRDFAGVVSAIKTFSGIVSGELAGRLTS
jgi:hypothetical protein